MRARHDGAAQLIALANDAASQIAGYARIRRALVGPWPKDYAPTESTLYGARNELVFALRFMDAVLRDLRTVDDGIATAGKPAPSGEGDSWRPCACWICLKITGDMVPPVFVWSEFVRMGAEDTTDLCGWSVALSDFALMIGDNRSQAADVGRKDGPSTEGKK